MVCLSFFCVASANELLPLSDELSLSVSAPSPLTVLSVAPASTLTMRLGTSAEGGIAATSLHTTAARSSKPRLSPMNVPATATYNRHATNL